MLIFSSLGQLNMMESIMVIALVSEGLMEGLIGRAVQSFSKCSHNHKAKNSQANEIISESSSTLDVVHEGDSRDLAHQSVRIVHW